VGLLHQIKCLLVFFLAYYGATGVIKGAKEPEVTSDSYFESNRWNALEQLCPIKAVVPSELVRQKLETIRKDLKVYSKTKHWGDFLATPLGILARD
jgi:hypothetical protein